MNRRDFMKGVGIMLSFLGGRKRENKPVDIPPETYPPLTVLHYRRSEMAWFDRYMQRVRESQGTLILNRPPQNDEAEREWIRSYFLFPVGQGFVRKSISVSKDATGAVWTWSIRDEEIPQSQRGV
jgi:uncharacterized protein Veg